MGKSTLIHLRTHLRTAVGDSKHLHVFLCLVFFYRTLSVLIIVLIFFNSFVHNIIQFFSIKVTLTSHVRWVQSGFSGTGFSRYNNFFYLTLKLSCLKNWQVRPFLRTGHNYPPLRQL